MSGWAGGSPTGQGVENPRGPGRKCLVLSYPCQGRHRMATKSCSWHFGNSNMSLSGFGCLSIPSANSHAALVSPHAPFHL